MSAEKQAIEAGDEQLQTMRRLKRNSNEEEKGGRRVRWMMRQ
jgi:hypothetical protein